MPCATLCLGVFVVFLYFSLFGADSIIELSNCQIIELSNCQIIELSNYRIVELSNCYISKSMCKQCPCLQFFLKYFRVSSIIFFVISGHFNSGFRSNKGQSEWSISSNQVRLFNTLISLYPTYFFL